MSATETPGLAERQPWSPSSWRAYPASQQPTYGDATKLSEVLEQLSLLPPLVTSWEIESLRREIADAQEGRRFLLQGGDCAERFSECQSNVISNRLKVLLQMSVVLAYGMRKPVIRVGRFAGQYAKPRSSDLETRDGVSLPSYRGDLINQPEFTAQSREPDPSRMIMGHARSAMTMNFVRALVDGGFADLHHPEYWDLAWLKESASGSEYSRHVRAIGDAVRFAESISGTRSENLSRLDFYTSHEALLLPYEEALTRSVPRHEGHFNLSTHFPWIGMRTASLGGAHAEYFRGIRNPVGIKISPSVTPAEIINVMDVLNPNGEAGRLAFIHRMGASVVEEKLPALVEAVKRDGRPVLWICDPMHGNTESTTNGFKTRKFANILAEVERSFAIHESCGTILGGVHLEVTGEDVTECTGGARDLTEVDLERAYRSSVDPRLNYEQALELSMAIVRQLAVTNER